MKRKSIPYGTKIPVKLTQRERNLIVDETFCDPDFAKLAVIDGQGIRAELTLEDIDEIQGYVAAAANHMKKSKLRKELIRHKTIDLRSIYSTIYRLEVIP